MTDFTFIIFKSPACVKLGVGPLPADTHKARQYNSKVLWTEQYLPRYQESKIAKRRKHLIKGEYLLETLLSTRMTYYHLFPDTSVGKLTPVKLLYIPLS